MRLRYEVENMHFHIILIVSHDLFYSDDAPAGNSSDGEDLSGSGEIDVQETDLQRTNEDHELKNKLFRKYSGYISTLKHEFSKKKKKGKLPKDAKQILTDWWNLHYKWPYPTVRTTY